MVPRRHGGEYTFAQARELALYAVHWLHDHGWKTPDAMDLHTYGPRLQDIAISDLQRVLDALVRTEDLVYNLLTPNRCRRPRRCYSATNRDYWPLPGGGL